MAFYGNRRATPGLSDSTPRETEIVRLLADGKANKEIAAQLEITVSTLETHRATIMHKIGVHSLVDLIYYAQRHGIYLDEGGVPDAKSRPESSV